MSHGTDPRGFTLASHDPAAAAACSAGIEGYNNWRADAMGYLDTAIDADDGFALPRIMKAWILVMGRSASYAPKVAQLIGEARARMGEATARDHVLLDALRAGAAGRGIDAATRLEAHLDQHPTDLLAHRLIQFELFWNGRAAWMCDVVERAAPHWNDAVPGYDQYLACRAFSNEEHGRYDVAEGYGREAVSLEPGSVWGAHAVAHVLVMQGRIDDGASWLEGLCGNWGEANQLQHHLWWHLCLFLLERGEHARILELLKTRIRNPESPLVQAVPDATIDLQNVASLLMRLELRGVDVGDAWESIADVCEGRVHNHANAFSNAHDMMVLAATGRFARAEELIDSVRAYVQEGDGSLVTSYRAAGIAACEAVLAHRRGEYARVIELLAPVRHDLALIGGSHAQRDVFYQLLVDAAHREGRQDLVSLFLRDVARIGFQRVGERTLYREVAKAA